MKTLTKLLGFVVTISAIFIWIAVGCWGIIIAYGSVQALIAAAKIAVKPKVNTNQKYVFIEGR